MKKAFIKVTNCISIATFFILFFAASAASQSITFTTSKAVGETVQLLVEGGGTMVGKTKSTKIQNEKYNVSGGSASRFVRMFHGRKQY